MVEIFLMNLCHYKDKYNEEKNNLNTKDRKNFDYKKLRLTDDYQYESENEEASQPGRLMLPKWIKVSEKDLMKY